MCGDHSRPPPIIWCAHQHTVTPVALSPCVSVCLRHICVHFIILWCLHKRASRAAPLLVALPHQLHVETNQTGLVFLPRFFFSLAPPPPQLYDDRVQSHPNSTTTTTVDVVVLRCIRARPNLWMLGFFFGGGLWWTRTSLPEKSALQAKSGCCVVFENFQRLTHKEVWFRRGR